MYICIYIHILVFINADDEGGGGMEPIFHGTPVTLLPLCRLSLCLLNTLRLKHPCALLDKDEDPN